MASEATKNSIAEVRSDLRGCLKANMASVATKMALKDNKHMDTKVIEFADYKSEVKFEFGGN